MPSDFSDFSRLTDVQWRTSHESEHGLFVAEGASVITRAWELGYTPRKVLTTARWQESLPADLIAAAELHVVDDVEMQSITGYQVHRGALASFVRPKPVLVSEVLDSANVVVVLEDIVDHENVGAIFRSAAGIGADAVLLSPTCADPLYRRSVKVSMGSTLSIPYARLDNAASAMAIFATAGFSNWALTPAGDTDLLTAVGQLDTKVALWFGTEGAGLTREAIAQANLKVTIPMQRQTDSLNVATSAAITLWAVAQRGSLTHHKS